MRPTINHPSILAFLPQAEASVTGRGAGVLGTLRIVLDAMRVGLSAAHDYRALTGRGLAPDAAAERVFADHFAAR